MLTHLFKQRSVKSGADVCECVCVLERNDYRVCMSVSLSVRPQRAFTACDGGLVSAERPVKWPDQSSQRENTDLQLRPRRSNSWTEECSRVLFSGDETRLAVVEMSLWLRVCGHFDVTQLRGTLMGNFRGYEVKYGGLEGSE